MEGLWILSPLLFYSRNNFAAFCIKLDLILILYFRAHLTKQEQMIWMDRKQRKHAMIWAMQEVLFKSNLSGKWANYFNH